MNAQQQAVQLNLPAGSYYVHIIQNGSAQILRMVDVK
jgi:hypothetical protein